MSSSQKECRYQQPMLAMWHNMIDLFTKFCHDENDFFCGDRAAMCWWGERKKETNEVSHELPIRKIQLSHSCASCARVSIFFSPSQLTASIVKTLAYIRPAGQNFVIEWDIFYPLPATWHTEKPKKPAPPPPPPTTAAPELEHIETFEHHDLHSGEIWVPPSGWSGDTDVIKSISDDKRRVWSESNVWENFF